MLPNLTELNLSNNDFGPTFDFSILPAQITAVDLRGNDIYKYENLVNIETAENGDEKITLVRDLTKFYLPEAAKNNCNEIVAYYNTDKEVDMKLEDAPYTTLREVPDAAIHEILKTSFPSLFDKTEKDKINLNNRLIDAAESQTALILAANAWGEPLEGVTSLEGIQYVVMNKGYNGTMFVASFAETDKMEMPYIEFNPNMAQMAMMNVSTPKMDLSKATNLCVLQVTNNEGLETLDLSNCKLLGQRDIDTELDITNPSSLQFVNCNNLKKIIFPKDAKNLGTLELTNTQALEELDLSRFDYIGTLVIAGELKCNITYLDYKWGKYPTAMFGTSEKIFAKPETLAFCKKYNDQLRQITPGMASGLPDFLWKNHINQ